MKSKSLIYRYNPGVDDVPYMRDYTLEAEEGRDMMLLDVLIQLKERDPSLSFRCSCREGVCGSDGLNMNGKNGLTYITPVSALSQPGKKTVTRPLSGLPVICDSVADMGQFYAQYEEIKPYLLNSGRNPPVREYLQMFEQHKKFDGLCKCILCACCSTSCPLLWWNPDEFINPAGLLVAYRFLINSCDTETSEHLEGLSDAFSIFRCHSAVNCVSVYPKGPNLTRTIGHIRLMLLQHNA